MFRYTGLIREKRILRFSGETCVTFNAFNETFPAISVGLSAKPYYYYCYWFMCPSERFCLRWNRIVWISQRKQWTKHLKRDIWRKMIIVTMTKQWYMCRHGNLVRHEKCLTKAEGWRGGEGLFGVHFTSPLLPNTRAQSIETIWIAPTRARHHRVVGGWYIYCFDDRRVGRQGKKTKERTKMSTDLFEPPVHDADLLSSELGLPAQVIQSDGPGVLERGRVVQLFLELD